MQPGYGSQMPYQQPPQYQRPPSPPGKTMAMISLICAGVSLLFGPLLSTILGSQMFSGGGKSMAMVATIMSVFGLLSGTAGVITGILGDKQMKAAGTPPVGLALIAVSGIVLSIVSMTYCFIFTIACGASACGGSMMNGCMSGLF